MSASPDGREAAGPTGPAPRRARARLALLFVVLVLGLAGLVHWASRPAQVAGLVLGQTGRVLGLEITAGGVSEYALRGTPRLVLRDVVARRPGDTADLLRARRILLALPWTTLRSRGRDLVIHRIELEAPELDVAALQRWLRTRPETEETRVPRLTDGFVVRGGRVIVAGWTIEGVDMDVPSLAPDAPVRAHVAGHALASGTRVPFDLRATLMRPARGAGLGIAGVMQVQRAQWRLELQPALSAVPDLDAGLALDRLRLRAPAVYESGPTRLPFALGIAGRATYAAGLRLRPLGLALRQGREIPDLDGGGELAWGRQLELRLEGRLARWPRGWPALPAPLDRPAGPLPYVLDYAGPTDLSGTTALQLEHRATRFEGRFRLPRVLEWLEGAARGTPLPPLDGRLRTPRLEIPGATLEGVEIEIEDGA